jgi:hypothetical protein
MSVEVQDNRAKLDAIMREIKRLDNAFVTVGIHGDKAQRKDDNETNPEIGAKHEFGSGNIPERSFLRSTIDGNKDLQEEMEQLSAAVARGQIRARVAAERLGLSAVDKVKRKIQAKIPPPLSPETIAKRAEKGAHGGGVGSMGGSTTPLIDSGQLIQSIQFKVGGNAGWGAASKTTEAETAGG